MEQSVAVAFAALLAASGAAVTPGWRLADVREYAMATCLAGQTEPALRDQGRAWAGVVVQRGPGDPARLRAVDAAVLNELARRDVPIVHDETNPAGGTPLWIRWCVMMADRPTVRIATVRAAR